MNLEALPGCSSELTMQIENYNIFHTKYVRNFFFFFSSSFLLLLIIIIFFFFFFFLSLLLLFFLCASTVQDRSKPPQLLSFIHLYFPSSLWSKRSTQSLKFSNLLRPPRNSVVHSRCTDCDNYRTAMTQRAPWIPLRG